ncbi:MAG: nucleoside triphosphate pyrophosphohydrolase family protein [Sarcina sp.]
MELKEYQKNVEFTMKKNVAMESALCDYGLGLTGEAGESVDIIKKGVFHGHDLDKAHLKNELGDVLWYVAALASTINVSLEEIAQINIDKLRKRYPEGFDKVMSINRVENKK